MKWKITTQDSEAFNLGRFLDADGNKSRILKLRLTNISDYFAEGIKIIVDGDALLSVEDGDKWSKRISLGKLGPQNYLPFQLKYQPKPRLNKDGEKIPFEDQLSFGITCTEWLTRS